MLTALLLISFTLFSILYIIVFTVFSMTLFLLYFYSVDILLCFFLCWTFHMFHMSGSHEPVTLEPLWTEQTPVAALSALGDIIKVYPPSLIVCSLSSKEKEMAAFLHFHHTHCQSGDEPLFKIPLSDSFNTGPLRNVERRWYKRLSVAITP